jgi:NADH-ubiquinone oxidoreductase chain 1
MTEHAAVIFVFFFLAEYASIVLICILTSILFLGGYLLNYIPVVSIIKDIIEDLFFLPGELDLSADLSSYPVLEGLFYGLSLGLKSSILIFTFI